ncbi:MAG: methanethiol S-methyltransferase [Bacteroidota bacterium]
MIQRTAFLLYGLFCYLVASSVTLLLIAFVGNFGLANTLDSTVKLPFWRAFFVNIGLIVIFGAQHSLMARASFKKWLATFLPSVLERSTYVLLSSLVLLMVIFFWQPLGGVVWVVENPIGQKILYGLFGLGWLLVAVSTFAIHHFDLFGLRQVYLFYKNKPYRSLEMEVPTLYQQVRHPLYLGFLIAFWATPTMTVSHLLFALLMTSYVLIGIYFEEKDLITTHGKAYKEYKEKVPMLLPFLRKRI